MLCDRSANSRPRPGDGAPVESVEYKNTIHDLLGVDYDAEGEFPPDDSGYGFDNISDVLTISPMLLEKYLDAAKAIVSEAVPTRGAAPAEKTVSGRSFHGEGDKAIRVRPRRVPLSYYQRAAVSNIFKIDQPGHYQINLDLTANETFVETNSITTNAGWSSKWTAPKGREQNIRAKAAKGFITQRKRIGSGRASFLLEIEPLTPEKSRFGSLTFGSTQLPSEVRWKKNIGSVQKS